MEKYFLNCFEEEINSFNSFNFDFLNLLKNDPVLDLSYFEKMSHPIFSNEVYLNDMVNMNPLEISIKYHLRQIQILILQNVELDLTSKNYLLFSLQYSKVPTNIFGVLLKQT